MRTGAGERRVPGEDPSLPAPVSHLPRGCVLVMRLTEGKGGVHASFMWGPFPHVIYP